MNLSFLLQQQLSTRSQQAATSWREAESESLHTESSDEEGNYDECIDDTDAYGDTVSASLLMRTTQAPASLRIDTSATANSCSAATAPNNNDHDVHVPPSNDLPSNDTDNLPPTPWRSSKAKQRIIVALKDKESDIYFSVGHYTLTNFDKVNFKRINKTYAGGKYKASLFKTNVKLLLKHSLEKTGPFKVEEAPAVEPWYTSVSTVSKAYSLLFLLYMDPSKTRSINDMTEEEVWKSHPQFQLYELEKFKNYIKNMKKLTNKRRNQIRDEEVSYERDMLKLPRNSKTSRGYPFWNDHLASELLQTDEMTGVAKEMKPVNLWESRLEYQDFPLAVFRKHIYQERSKQLSAPYWQHRRNKNAKKKFEEAQEMMREWHQDKFGRDLEGMIDDWGRINLEADETV